MITITIRTDNAAFQGEDYHDELAHVLERIAAGLRSGHSMFNPRDTNGNTVGAVKLTGQDKDRL